MNDTMDMPFLKLMITVEGQVNFTIFWGGDNNYSIVLIQTYYMDR